MIELILFDLGNTLIYFDGEWLEVMAEARKAVYTCLVQGGLELSEQRFLQVFHRAQNRYYLKREKDLIEHTMAEILRRVLASLDLPRQPDALIREALDAMYCVSQKHWQAEHDSLPTLEALAGRGYRLGLISNASDDWDVQQLIDKAGLRPYLDLILTSAAFGLRKPHPQIFRAALDHWGLPPSRAAMVGDTLNADILGASNLGMFTIWITRRAHSPTNRENQNRILPDAVIGSLEDLLSEMSQLSN